jgi:2-keto-3-deoxy-L-rhamnonate aldolase RhmA
MTTQHGVMIAEFAAPSLPLLVQRAGFDFALIDTEHGSYSSTELKTLLMGGVLLPIPLYVRVPDHSAHGIAEVLDLGAAGIVVPHVDSVADAETVVRAARYAPLGARGMSTMKAHTRYDPTDAAAIIAHANATVQVLVQIESRAALDAVEEIAAVPGVDGLIVGPNDLMQDLGMPGRLDHDDLRAAVARVAHAAEAHGILSGTISSNLDYLELCSETSMSWFVVGSDVGHFLAGARAALGRVR